MLLPLVLLAGTGPATGSLAAQQGAAGWEVGVLGTGGHLIGTTYEGGDLARGGGLTVGHGWTSGFALVVGGRIWQADIGEPVAQDVDGVEAWAQGTWRFATASAVAPLLGARAGWIRLERAGETVRGGVGALLGGVDVRASERVALRALGVAAPFGVSDVPNVLDSGIQLGMELGLTFSFGRRPPAVEGEGGRLPDRRS